MFTAGITQKLQSEANEVETPSKVYNIKLF